MKIFSLYHPLCYFFDKKESKILDAQSRYESLESLNRTINISEELIRNIITNKKHLLGSADEADQKEVLQEFVDQIVIQPSDHLDNFRTEMTYRVFRYGGELTLLNPVSTKL